MSSANTSIPFDIQVEIIKKVVPVKSLLCFRSVSKQWKRFIDSPEFISHRYSLVKQTQPPQLLVSYNTDSHNMYVLTDDDDSFPHNKFYPTPPSISFDSSEILGYSHGLVCLSSRIPDPRNQKELIVVWNPSIRKSVGIMLLEGIYVVGFGVCPKTLDPKIVKITRTTTNSIDRKAEVLTLSTRAWKSVSMNNLSMPLKLEGLHEQQVVVDGTIHWVDYDLTKKDDKNYYRHRIVSFDLTSEEFGEVFLPDIFSHGLLSIKKLKESLALISYSADCGDVWMMKKNGDPKCSFAKLYSVRLDSLILPDMYSFNTISIIGSRKNGQLIRQHIFTDDNGSRATLEAYEPYTQHSKKLEFDEIWHGGFSVTSYTESLLLLNHSSFLIK